MEKTLFLASIGAIFMVASAIPRSSIYNSDFHDEYYPGLRQFDNSQKGAIVTKAECEKNWQELKDILCEDCCAEVLPLWDEKSVTDCVDGWMADGTKKAFMEQCDAKCTKDVTPECKENWEELKDALCADCCDEENRELWEGPKVMKCMLGWMNNAPMKPFMNECNKKCERKDSSFRKYARSMMVADNKRFDRNPFQQYRRRDYGSPNDQKKSMYGRIAELYDYQRPLRRRHDVG